MNSERIKQIQLHTAYPESHSVKRALLQVWNECEQERPYTEQDMIAFGRLCHNDAHSANASTTFKLLLEQFKSS